MQDNTQRHPRFFTKSKFALAAECATKLFYVDKPEFSNSKTENTFLEALAEGGFQVGALARCEFPQGKEIRATDPDSAVKETLKFFQEGETTLFEAAFLWKRCFVRTDILVRKGKRIDLYEVKAKSYSPGEPFLNQREAKQGRTQLLAKWEKYFLDVTFQTYVLKQAFPAWEVHPHLVLVDTSTQASVEGLHQKFRIEREGNQTRVIARGDLSPEALGNSLLTKVPVDTVVDALLADPAFAQGVENLSSHFDADRKISPVLGSHCKKCEFRNDTDTGISGFHACWKGAFRSEPDCVPSFEVWGISADRLIESGNYCIQTLTQKDIAPVKETPATKPGLTRLQRQWLQIEKLQKHDPQIYLDKKGLQTELNSWQFPLHFIDFETMTAAIPFHKGRRPYESIAFQFSHHTIDEKGQLEHRGEFLSTETGVFPNFAFLRALKQQLEKDSGTVLRYSNHEKTILSEIGRQLLDASPTEVPDKGELLTWLQTFLSERSFVDLLEVVKAYYYAPQMGGSNSLKKVLPATLQASPYLQHRYTQPIYGSEQIPSRNYQNHRWLDPAQPPAHWNPYALLPELFEDFSNDELDQAVDLDVVEGGSAMMAFARMQFTEMTQSDREVLRSKLLRYCELDTLAMALLYEAWREWLG